MLAEFARTVQNEDSTWNVEHISHSSKIMGIFLCLNFRFFLINIITRNKVTCPEEKKKGKGMWKMQQNMQGTVRRGA